MFGLVLIEALLGAAIYLMARRFGKRPSLSQISLLFASAAPPLFGGVWGLIFWVEPGSSAENPAWVVHALSVCFYGSIVATVAAIVFSRGYRIPTAAFALPQIPLAWGVGFLGIMQVTGSWI